MSFNSLVMPALKAIGIDAFQAPGPVGNYNGKPYVIETKLRKDFPYFDDFVNYLIDHRAMTVAMYKVDATMVRFAIVEANEE